MSLLTTWGYTITGEDALEDMLTVNEFNNLTGGRYAGYATQIAAEIPAAGQAIRNFVGWHLAPSEACELKTTFYDRRVTRVGHDVMIQLPARYVSGIESVSIGGTEQDDYVLDPSGILRVLNVQIMAQSAEIIVDYTAGLPDSLMAPIKDLIASRITHSVALPAGITSEASGGVSVTYNANWINNSRTTSLDSGIKELLTPYMVTGVF